MSEIRNSDKNVNKNVDFHLASQETTPKKQVLSSRFPLVDSCLTVIWDLNVRTSEKKILRFLFSDFKILKKITEQ